MKTVKENSVKLFVIFSLLIIVVFGACTQSGGSKSENKSETATAIKAPSIDLHTAILSNNIEVVKQHIEAGSNINVKEQMSGSTPIISAVVFNKKEIAESLIAAGADLNLKNNEGASALHVAAFFGRIEMVQMLLDAKVDKTLKNNFGVTARESVLAPFPEVKPIYEMIQQQMKPMGLEIDFEEVKTNRPIIALMLQ